MDHEPDEQLRIVSDELWARVKNRQRQRAYNVGEQVKAGRSKKAAAIGREPRHVFSGWLTCSRCSARFTLESAVIRVRVVLNGRACTSGRLVRRTMVEDRLLARIRMTLNGDEYLDALEPPMPESIDVIIRQTKPDVGRIADLKGQIDNLVSAIASGACARPGDWPQS